nr:immunoglobulin light chain junction region [Macaca mulatta]MOX13318.1 immunoglobulin light chain junction region [Macaca mulatta]
DYYCHVWHSNSDHRVF